MQPETRLLQERVLLELLQQRVDGKIRHGLSGAGDRQELAQIVLDPSLSLVGTAALLLDQFRFRLAHVAMRCREWLLARQFPDIVLAGPAPLRLARLCRIVCDSQFRKAPLHVQELQELVQNLVCVRPADRWRCAPLPAAQAAITASPSDLRHSMCQLAEWHTHAIKKGGALESDENLFLL